jgi:hypothetical protein
VTNGKDDLFAKPAAIEAGQQDQHEPEISCLVLIRLAEYLPEFGLTKSARNVAFALCGYFDIELRSHIEGQEDDLFPVLRARADRAISSELDALLAQLHEEHVRIRGLWCHLRLTLENIADCRADATAAPQLRDFADVYRAHLAGEHERLSGFVKQILVRT